MNDRERFLQIAGFERTGDPYDFHQWIWLEAIERWQTEGLPREAHPLRVVSLGQDRTEFLSVYNLSRCGRPYFNPPYYVAIVPWFERSVLQDEKDTQVVRDEDGIVYRISKSTPGVLPQYLEYPVKDRATWNEYKKLLDPSTRPGGLPVGIGSTSPRRCTTTIRTFRAVPGTIAISPGHDVAEPHGSPAQFHGAGELQHRAPR